MFRLNSERCGQLQRVSKYLIKVTRNYSGRGGFRAAPANGKAQVKVPASSVPQPKTQVLITGVNEDTLSYILGYENEAKPLIRTLFTSTMLLNELFCAFIQQSFYFI